VRFIPSQPYLLHPTGGSIFGLFSFQISAVLLYSFVAPIIPDESAIRYAVAGALTVLAGLLYGLYAESEVPGAIRDRHLRRTLAWRTSLLTFLIALVPMLVFKMVKINVLQFSPQDLYMWAYLLGAVLLMPFLELWVGLGLAAWLKRQGPKV
jgi:hypothetical protein